MDAQAAHHILLVEDDRFFAQLLQKRVAEELGYEVLWTSTLAETLAQLHHLGEKRIIAAILDYHLPDAPDGEVINTVIGHDIPAIVFTGLLDQGVRERIWSNRVADYALKGQPNSIDYVISVVRRIAHNHERQVLVVDDSLLFQRVMSNWLKIHRYQVLSATSGQEALEMLRRHPGIKLAIIDYFMPGMDGVELIHAIRETHAKEELAIIGISGADDHVMSAKFLKSGANDFMVKDTIIPEEFYCRVNQCIENNENIHAIREAAIKDFLTGLYNRRYFFEAGLQLFANAQRHNTDITCAMIDIDLFKKVNDQYGHEAGDLALQHVAALVARRTRSSDLAARLGGEEFCILAMGMNSDDCRPLFELLRKTVEENPVALGDGRQITVTISIGVCPSRQNSLTEMLATADRYLYEAKASGRNRVVAG